MSEFHSCSVPSDSLAILQASLLLHTVSFSQAQLSSMRKAYSDFISSTPARSPYVQKSPTSPVHLSYKLDLPSLDQLLGCVPGYPSQAGTLVDRIQGSQKLFSKHIGTLSPRNVLGGKRRRVVMQGTYDQITFCLFRNKLFGRSYCALSIH